MDTLKCLDCGYHFNVATGTFGSGLPTECPNCHTKPNFEHVCSDWRAEELNKKV